MTSSAKKPNEALDTFAMRCIAAITTGLIGIAFATGCVTQHESSSSEITLGLSYQEFDQTPHSGWRALEGEKRYREAAQLIEMYLERHPELSRFQRAILHWHAGQMLAFAGDTAGALNHMSSARFEPDPPNSATRWEAPGWNDYVDATVAFLQHDRAKLLAARERLASNSPTDPNLRVVDSLIAHFGAPYATVYGAKR